MRRTRWTFAVAMVLLTVGVTRPSTVPEKESDRALDFAGIERLRFQTDGNVDIIVGDGAPVLEIAERGDVDIDVVVERHGDTLHVTTSSAKEGYYRGRLVVPATLAHIDLHGSVDIEAVRPVRTLRITTTHAMGWEGDAGRLEIVRRRAGKDSDPDAAVTAAPEEAGAQVAAAATAAGAVAAANGSADEEGCDCGAVDIDGSIDELFVTVDEGRVFIDRAGGHGQVTLDLAEGVRFDLENAVDLQGVTLIRRPAAAPAGPAGTDAIPASSPSAGTEPEAR